MKIMQVNCVYGTGSTGKIVHDINTELRQRGIDSVACYGRGEKSGIPGVYKTCSEFYSHVNHFLAKITGVMYGGCFFSTGKLISLIKKEKPDIVHLHCINGYFVNIYRLVNWLKKNRIKTVVTLHAEFMHTGGCAYAFECEKWKDKTGCRACEDYKAYTGSVLFDRTHTMWKRMKDSFDDFEDGLVITSVSPWLKKRAERSSILAGKDHRTVLNGISTEVFRQYDEIEKERVRKEFDLPSAPFVLHATAAFSSDKSNIKGGHYVLKLAEMMPNTLFVVAGEVIDNITPPSNLILLGRVANQKHLATLYSMADATLLTSRRETFSMIVAESLSCGTPVVGFYAGAPETIAIDDYCTFVDFADLDSLKKALEDSLSKHDKQSVSRSAHNVYSREKMVDDYIKVYQELLG